MTLRTSLIPCLALAALLALQALWPSPAHAAPDCLLLYGHGRNVDESQPARNAHWDDLNTRFNLAVREPLAATGLPVASLVLPVVATDLPSNLQRLLREAARLGCARVMETTVFADDVAGLLVLRLRLYPLLPVLGPQAQPNAAGLRVGPVAYTQQREFRLDARVMERVDVARVGREMAAEALETALKGVGKQI